MKNTKWNYKLGYAVLPERRELEPEGEYIVPPPFKYNLWDFIKDILGRSK